MEFKWNEKIYYVYIMASINKVIYIGFTDCLIKRGRQHKKGFYDGFTKKYKVNKLVYFESFDTLKKATKREKELKGWKRNRKIELIEKDNSNWQDLYLELISIYKTKI